MRSIRKALVAARYAANEWPKDHGWAWGLLIKSNREIEEVDLGDLNDFDFDYPPHPSLIQDNAIG